MTLLRTCNQRSRSQCRLTGHCTVMPLSTYGSLHQSPTSSPGKYFGLPPRTICAFLPSDCLLLDVVLSLSLAPVFGTLFLPTSLQHLLCSLSETFKTASFSTLLSWPCPLSYLFSWCGPCGSCFLLGPP